VVDEALEASRNTLVWLWDGLGPAERVVASALAEAGPGPITQTQLEQVLQESGVRVIIRELQNAPQLLQEWDIIEPVDGSYRFRVELLRRWIAEHKPLSRVQEEMDRIEPVANSYYNIGLRFYRRGNLEEAVEPLERAIKLNPNHIGANQLLADVYLAQDQAEQARQILERLETYHPTAVRPRLIQAILAQAEIAKDEDTKLTLYKDVLARDPNQPEALNGAQRIQQRRERLVLQTKQREGLIVPKLSLWNPLDYLRLPLWIFTMPAKLKIHRETFGKKEEKRIGRLISNLALLPLLTLIGGLALGKLPSAIFSTKLYLQFNIMYITILII
jgi:tetratricopeptide (TPR) repeat protein